MKNLHRCRTFDHLLHRRQFFAHSAVGVAGMLGLGSMIQPARGEQLRSAGKRVLLLFQRGGLSQLESWDPKPGSPTGGPFRAIPTSVPGTHICDLLPHTARQMHRIALVRSVNSGESGHGPGTHLMQSGRPNRAGSDYPHLGSVCSKLLAPAESAVPSYMRITAPGGAGGHAGAGFLGPRYEPVVLPAGKPPVNLDRHQSLSQTGDRQRNELRRRLDRRFAEGRRSSKIDAYSHSFEQAARLMGSSNLFKVDGERRSTMERYGDHELGRNLLLARHLFEREVTFVTVEHGDYDTHYDNFNFHIGLLGEFDRSFATFIDDLADRGMLESTLVVVMGEFGRTPKINPYYGRDHWSAAWSVALAGCGIQPGAVIGKTNEKGTAVTDRQVHAGHLFHTFLRAVGIDSTIDHDVRGKAVPVADPSAEQIEELLI